MMNGRYCECSSWTVVSEIAKLNCFVSKLVDVMGYMQCSKFVAWILSIIRWQFNSMCFYSRETQNLLQYIYQLACHKKVRNAEKWCWRRSVSKNFSQVKSQKTWAIDWYLDSLEDLDTIVWFLDF